MLKLLIGGKRPLYKETQMRNICSESFINSQYADLTTGQKLENGLSVLLQAVIL